MLILFFLNSTYNNSISNTMSDRAIVNRKTINDLSDIWDKN